MQPKFCPECGNKISQEEFNFCSMCGARLNNTIPQKEIPVASPPRARVNPNQNNLIAAQKHFTNALYYFEQTMDTLRGAKTASTFDTFFGGGFLTDAIKFNKVDKARQLVNQAGQALNAGYALVPQAPRIHNVSVHENSMWDMFFDNIFSDWSAREKIKESLRSVEIAISETQNVLNWINSQLKA